MHGVMRSLLLAAALAVGGAAILFAAHRIMPVLAPATSR